MLEEARRIVEKGTQNGITLRLMGAAAVQTHCPNYLSLHKSMGRELTDLDFMSYSKYYKKVGMLFQEEGYAQVKSGYAMAISSHGERYLFEDLTRHRHADVFFDRLKMCHTIEFKGRLETDYPTISLADLLLEKTQIVKINEKDVKDVVIMFREHDVGTTDKETINQAYIADRLSKEWGFYYTVTNNLKGVKDYTLKAPQLMEEDRRDIEGKIDATLDAIEKEPKTMGWNMRAKVGTRKKWYDDVEETPAL
jgi:hypothetical protein